MMVDTTEVLPREQFPPLLKEIPEPPKTLRYRGVLPDFKNPELKFLCVVGARKYTAYGKSVVTGLIEGLRGYPIIIISGLALGIDALAHEAALDNQLTTIAVPGSGLDDGVLYPRTNLSLARRILEAGGCLLSEFEDDFKATTWSFPQRNRIMAGLAHAVLVIEAEQKSGTLITSRLATDYNREVLAVPGPITQSTSAGPHMLIRLGATPVTSSKDILEVFGIETVKDTEHIVTPKNLSPEEEKLWQIINEPKSKDEIAIEIALPITTVSAIISLLELRGLIREENGRFHKTIL